ncbi:MAG: hypothetical protein LBH92_03505 [Bacteroidales bacterium]|jgi:predicted transcriptional regulator|nr:hypothetical protein [Bacteroidales bacterium]
MGTNLVKKEKRIWLRFGMQREIAKIMGCTEQTVWNALTYRTDSEKAQQIRALAEKKLQELNN